METEPEKQTEVDADDEDWEAEKGQSEQQIKNAMKKKTKKAGVATPVTSSAEKKKQQKPQAVASRWRAVLIDLFMSCVCCEFVLNCFCVVCFC